MAKFIIIQRITERRDAGHRHWTLRIVLQNVNHTLIRRTGKLVCRRQHGVDVVGRDTIGWYHAVADFLNSGARGKVFRFFTFEICRYRVLG